MNYKTDFIPFALPKIGEEEEAAALRVLRSGWLTTGKETQAFEREFAAYVNAPHAAAVNSATAGLHLALEALGVGPGDRVLTTPYTFTATAEVIRYLGAHPVFVDIEPDGFNIDPELLERELESGNGKPAAIVPVHIGGQPCRMDRILELSRSYGVPVVEDAAHAFPVRTPDGYLGTLGEIGVYSFYATKTITTGEGGMLVTGNDEIARRVRIMRLHGIDREIWDRYTSKKPAWQYEVVEAGFKYNMTDLAAAIGREQLRKAEAFLEERRRIAAQYRAAFEDREYLVLPPDTEHHAWHLFILRLVPEKLSIGRDELIEKLSEAGIGTSVHYIPLHLMPYYARTYDLSPGDFPRSTARFAEVMSLPIYPGLTQERILYIIRTVLQIGDHYYRSAVHVDKRGHSRHPEGSGQVH